MSIHDLKLTIINSIVLAATTLIQIENIFKIILLLISILYTSLKTYEFYINKIKNKNNNNETE